MDKLILLRQGIDSLNIEEYRQCITQIQRDVLSAIIFKGLYREINDDKLSNVNNINAIIKKIKESHQNKYQTNNNNIEDDTPDEDEQIKLDTIPFVLLSEISSFLHFNDVINLEQANRSTLIGIRSSNLPLYSLSDDNCLKLIKYNDQHKLYAKYISKMNIFKAISMDVVDFAPWQYRTGENILKYECNQQFFNYIESLHLKVEDDTDLSFILGHLFETSNLQNVKTFRVIPSSQLASEFHLNEAADPFFINKFSEQLNLEYFEISAKMIRDDHAITITNYEWVSLLKGISVTNIDTNGEEIEVMKNIYRSIGNNLQSFHIGTTKLSNDINGKLIRLKEICLPWNQSKDDLNILLTQNMNQLERIYFRDIGNAKIDKESNQLMKLLLDKIMNSVEYIGMNISKDANINWVLDTMDILIKSIRNRQQLKIRINGMGILANNLSIDIVSKIECLINSLNSNCVNWMLIGYEWNVGLNDDKYLCNLLKKIENEYSVSTNNYNVNNFVISNKKCSINGYYEPWIMKCQFCDQPAISQ